MREIPLSTSGQKSFTLPARRRDQKSLDWSKSFWSAKLLDEKELRERVEKGLTVSPY